MELFFQGLLVGAQGPLSEELLILDPSGTTVKLVQHGLRKIEPELWATMFTSSCMQLCAGISQTTHALVYAQMIACT